jgi:hypothetical protein|tara:strand:+ start:217 stop:1071 length:855 start_codon:yes stop_codon:yes gene_type:complete
LSRNKDRVGAQNINTEPPPAQVVQGASEGFSFVVPTEFVELPSQGKFYPQGHPLYGQSCIEIKQMTAKEEDMLSSRSLLKKGLALERVIQSVIVDKTINPDSLFVGDKNAIIIATRVSGYGNLYETKVNCPSCGENQKYSFDLNDGTAYHGENFEQLSIIDNGDGTFEVELPKTKINVVFRLLTGNDEKTLLNAVEEERKARGEERLVTRQLANMVVSANGDSSIEARRFLVNNIPSIDSRHLRLAYKLAAPNIDLTQVFECRECDFTLEMEVPLSADFFWPDR